MTTIDSKQPGETNKAEQAELSDIELEIDCAPGSARPDAILIMILKVTNGDLTSDDFVRTHAFFGQWTFMLKKGKEAAYRKHKPELGKVLTDLYQRGGVRYASW